MTCQNRYELAASLTPGHWKCGRRHEAAGLTGLTLLIKRLGIWAGRGLRRSNRAWAQKRA